MSRINFIQKIKKPSGARVKMHSHDAIECVIYLKANGTTDIGGRQYRITDGSVAIINAGEPHNEIHSDSADIVCFVSDFDLFYIPSGVYRPKNIADITKIALQILFKSGTHFIAPCCQPKQTSLWYASCVIFCHGEILQSLKSACNI